MKGPSPFVPTPWERVWFLLVFLGAVLLLAVRQRPVLQLLGWLAVVVIVPHCFGLPTPWRTLAIYGALGLLGRLSNCRVRPTVLSPLLAARRRF